MAKTIQSPTDKIEAAIRALECWNGEETTISCLVPEIAMELATVAAPSRAPEWEQSTDPVQNALMRPTRHGPLSRSAASKELKAIRAAGLRLLELLGGSHGTTLSKLDIPFSWRDRMKADLAALTEACDNATVDDLPMTPGAPKNALATAIATRAAEHYLYITGLKPTRAVDLLESTAYGPFLDFLGAIFEARGISASVEGEAKKAVAYMAAMDRSSHDMNCFYPLAHQPPGA